MLRTFQGTIIHSLTRPAVYLDHWALVKFSDNCELSDRFISGLRRSGGTLCISGLNVAETCRMEDPRHAHNIDRFLRDVGQQVYCADVLATFQSEQPYTGTLKAPPADQDLAREMLEPTEFCIPGTFGRSWMHRKKVAPDFDYINAKVASRFAEFRETTEYRERARIARPNRQIPWIHIIVSELMRPAILNLHEGIAENDTPDLQHAVMGLMHCDLVVLDGKWADRAASLRKRLGERGSHLAWCFSGRGNGCENFLRALETYPRCGTV